jgi:hypothetical protein
MEKDDRLNGNPEKVVGNREPQRASRPAPGKVTRTSKLSPSRGAAVQRKAVAPTQEGTTAPKARSPGELTMDPWMDAAHRGVTALAERGHDMVQAAGPIQAKGLKENPESPVGLPGHGGGAEIPEEVRGKMETAFGVDFSPVRIHEGPHAETVGALAYTQGTDIHFAPGQYDPQGRRGQELLGHELAHVVQQAEGRVAATTQAKGLPVNDDQGLEREADDLGNRAAAGEAAPRASRTLAIRRSLGATQMKPVVQMAPVNTHYGTFKDEAFNVLKDGSNKEIGVEMYLKFTPNTEVDAKLIGMTQSVRSLNNGTPIFPGPTEQTRAITAADAIPFNSPVKGTDEVFQIDQSGANRNPLYAVEGAPASDTRLAQGPTPSPVTALTPAQQAANTASTGASGAQYDGWGEHGYRYKDGNAWKTKDATLHDSPMVPSRTKKAEQLFETTALAIDGTQEGTYYGSVQWGWRTDDKGKFQKVELSVVTQGVPSSTFLKAAQIWNTGKSSTGAANLPLPTVDVHLVNKDAGVVLNEGLTGPYRQPRLPRGTRVQIIDRNSTDPAGARKADVKIVDGPETGARGWLNAADLSDERA